MPAGGCQPARSLSYGGACENLTKPTSSAFSLSQLPVGTGHVKFTLIRRKKAYIIKGHQCQLQRTTLRGRKTDPRRGGWPQRWIPGVATGAAVPHHRGLYALRKGVDPKDNAAVNTLLPEIGLRVDCIDGEQHIYLNGEDVSTAIRTEEAGMAASAVGANPEVRAFLLELQRGMTKTQNVLMDGRDIGTVVLPDATVKIFLTAAPEARARRRWLEYQQKGMEVAFEDVLADVKQRDYQDTHRAAAPLKQAGDAVLLDTSDLNFEQSLAAMKKIIAEKVN